MGEMKKRHIRKTRPRIRYKYRAILPNGIKTPICTNYIKLFIHLKERNILTDEDLFNTSENIKQILQDRNILLEDLTWDKHLIH